MFDPISARLQAPETAADKKPDQQESDITSQEVSVHTPSPRRNGSVTNFQSPVRRGNSIRTITQSASRVDLNRGAGAGSVRHPSVNALPKHRWELHLPHTLTYSFIFSHVLSLFFSGPHHFLVAQVALASPSPTITWHLTPKLAVLTTSTLTHCTGRPNAPYTLWRLLAS